MEEVENNKSLTSEEEEEGAARGKGTRLKKFQLDKEAGSVGAL